MQKIKQKIALKVAKIKEKLNKIKANKVADLLTLVAFFIIFFTTFLLNKYIGMYILAVLLLITGYFINN